jgi:preprotein translocase subunit YajC
MGPGGGMFGPGSGGTMGKVTAISGTELTIQDDQGQAFKIDTGPNSRIRKNREEAKISDIKIGDTIVAGGNLDEQAKAIGAMFVMVLDPQQAAEAEKRRATFGKTWTAGRITAIKDLTITIERPDKVTQTVAVDENTTFHKGARGQATDITFPDIKVGEMMHADGAVQGNNFLATNVVVMEPRQPGERRFGSDGSPSGGQPGSHMRQHPQPEGTGSAPPQQPQAGQN